MNAITLMLDNQQYRYAKYENTETNQSAIFLLGALQEIESVQFFCEYFAKTLNVIVVELPGTGLNPPLPSTYPITGQSKFLLQFIEFLGLNSAHILAFSYSTAVAIELYSIWDGVLSISICGGVPGIPEAGRLRTIAMMADALRDRREFSKEFIDTLTVEDKNIPRGKVIARSAMQKVFKYTDAQLISFCENTIRLLGYKPSFNLSEISIPCSLCVGEKDPYVTHENALSFVKSLANCSFTRVKNSDHLVHIQHPEEIAKLMIFLAKEEKHAKMNTFAPMTAA
ncbi:MAG: alpha/beta hydrolase [Cellvibrionaceae bacterium]|nr:alpha/beta hydrolase [Cellvibrionaceae bacterium]